MVNHDNLVNHYKSNHILQSSHGFSLWDLENMMPWERLVYLDLIIQKMETEKRAAIDMAHAQRDAQSLLRKMGQHG